MTVLLHIIASVRGELSHSRQAGQAAVLRLLALYPALTVIERDPGRNPVAHPDARNCAKPHFRKSGSRPLADRLVPCLHMHRWFARLYLTRRPCGPG